MDTSLLNTTGNARPHKVILALPAFNEADNLRPLVQEAVEIFKSNQFNYTIIIVNDGSTDNTDEVLQELARDFGVTVVEHTRNRGLGEAIVSGLKQALTIADDPNSIIVNMDADNTHSPAYIPEMVLKIIRDNYDIVIASRYQDGSQEVGVPLFRRLLSRAARLTFQLFLRLPEVRDYTCGFRAYRASLIEEAYREYGSKIIQRQGFACTDELLIRLSKFTRKITEVPFVLRYDQKRSASKLPLMKTIIETLKMLFFTR